MSHETIVFQIQFVTAPFHPNAANVEGNSPVKYTLFGVNDPVYQYFKFNVHQRR